ncbi:formylglycine-generating enzyme family protein [Dechloromonas sp. ZS-1]|uniref:formylglycine-generating enzyme family protein n=1 Tax=Dechloromonas sp. ZS-1 TaxID=3138067 RepID=UPI0031FDE106
MISGTILLQGFLVCILLMPLLAFWRAREKKESFGRWVVRAEHAVTSPLVTRLQRSYWLTPGTYLQLLFWAGCISYPVLWLFALGSFLGLFQADLDRGLASLLGIWLEFAVLIASIWYFPLNGLRDKPPALDVRRYLLGLPQVLLYSLLILNIYGLFTADIAFDGYKGLIWRHDSNKETERVQFFYALLVLLPLWVYVEKRVPGEGFFECLERVHQESKARLEARLKVQILLTPLSYLAHLRYVLLGTYPFIALLAAAMIGSDLFGWGFLHDWRDTQYLPRFIRGWIVGLLIFSLLLLPYYTSTNKRHGLSEGSVIGLLAVQVIVYGVGVMALTNHFYQPQLTHEEEWALFFKTGKTPSWHNKPAVVPPLDPEGLAQRYAGRVIEPELVSIPAGEYVRGCPPSEKRCDDDINFTLRTRIMDCKQEGGVACEQRNTDEPRQQKVTVAGFAMGKYEVTFEEWDACVADKGCQHWPDDEGFGRGKRPVINVSWDHIQEYLHWLNARTGKNFRLPTSTEWEYAARAGATTRFSTGDCLTTRQANINGKIDYYCKGDTPDTTNPAVHRNQTLPVGSFPPNPWGLYDMHGNVAEILADCPFFAQKDAAGKCDGYAYRGGDWWIHSDRARSYFRSWTSPGQYNQTIGFRLAVETK